MCSLSVAREIAFRHFDKKTVESLEKKGVKFAGIQGAPLFDGDVYNCDVAYSIIIGDELSAIRTHAELRTMASSSWNAKEFLQQLED